MGLLSSGIREGGAPSFVSITTDVGNADSTVDSFKVTSTVASVVAVPTSNIDNTGARVFSLQFNATSVIVAANRSTKPAVATTMIIVAIFASFRCEEILIG